MFLYMKGLVKGSAGNGGGGVCVCGCMCVGG